MRCPQPAEKLFVLYRYGFQESLHRVSTIKVDAVPLTARKRSGVKPLPRNQFQQIVPIARVANAEPNSRIGRRVSRLDFQPSLRIKPPRQVLCLQVLARLLNGERNAQSVRLGASRNREVVHENVTKSFGRDANTLMFDVEVRGVWTHCKNLFCKRGRRDANVYAVPLHFNVPVASHEAGEVEEVFLEHEKAPDAKTRRALKKLGLFEHPRDDDARLLAIPASRGRVSAPDPNLGRV